MKYFFDEEQEVYYKKLENGLDVYVLPNNNIKGYRVEVVTKYGSEMEDFIPFDGKEYIHLPLGVAHFLEHKVFDMEKSDPFEYFSKTGTYVNAGTTYFYTKYYIDGKKEFNKNFDYLLSMVFTPFFQKESVEKEKSIISEEIKMYDDEPEWILDDAFRKSFFNNIVKEKIAGTTESIKEIDDELLLKTYKTFYQPSNMFVVATGNVFLEKVVEVIQKNKALNNWDVCSSIVYKDKEESSLVAKEYKQVKGKIVIPKLKYGYKFDLNEISFANKRLLKFYLGAMFSILFNDASEFNEEVLEKKLSTSFYAYYTSVENIYLLSIEAESEYADLFVESVDKTLANIHITEEDLERIKKVWYSVLIRNIDSKAALADYVIDELIKEGSLSDTLELIKSLNYQELLEIIQQLDFTNKSLVLMVPNE